MWPQLGVATSDGGYVLVGGGGESEGSPYAESALKVSSTEAFARDERAQGRLRYRHWRSSPMGRHSRRWPPRDWWHHQRSVTKLSLATGARSGQLPILEIRPAHSGLKRRSTSRQMAAILSGWHETDTSPMGYRSGGNTFGGQAVVMKFPVSAMGATAPTSAKASWTKIWKNHNAAHAARSLSTGEIAVLLWTDEDPNAFPKSLVWGSAAVTKLNADGTDAWGPINQGSAAGKPNQEGTDLQISKDGTEFVVGGHGYCAGSTSGGAATARFAARRSA